MTPCSPMAFSNLNNPYSPQPATPAGSTSGEDVFNMSHNAYMGDGMVSAVSNVEDVTNQQVVLDQRSRHNSAESDPSLVKSAPMSPASVMNQNNSYVEIGGQRLRHQSAGNPPNPALATLKPPDWIQDPTLTFATSDDLQVHLFKQNHKQIFLIWGFFRTRCLTIGGRNPYQSVNCQIVQAWTTCRPRFLRLKATRILVRGRPPLTS